MADDKCCGEDVSESKCCGTPEPEPPCCGAPEPDPETTCCGAAPVPSACCAAGGGKPMLSVAYDANVHATAKHVKFGEPISLETCGLPADQAQMLNPIDLSALGLASCLLIVMGKAAQARNLCIVGAHADVCYETANYRIAAYNVKIHMPAKMECADRARIEASHKSCPVFLAINPEVKVNVEFVWPE
ncbi:MAG: OsmC family protein [Armatimonadota bacterium]